MMRQPLPYYPARFPPQPTPCPQPPARPPVHTAAPLQTRRGRHLRHSYCSKKLILYTEAFACCLRRTWEKASASARLRVRAAGPAPPPAPSLRVRRRRACTEAARHPARWCRRRCSRSHTTHGIVGTARQSGEAHMPHAKRGRTRAARMAHLCPQPRGTPGTRILAVRGCRQLRRAAWRLPRPQTPTHNRGGALLPLWWHQR